jgi:hypothetical protein
VDGQRHLYATRPATNHHHSQRPPLICRSRMTSKQLVQVVHKPASIRKRETFMLISPARCMAQVHADVAALHNAVLSECCMQCSEHTFQELRMHDAAASGNM